MSFVEERRVFPEHAKSITSGILNVDADTLPDTEYFVMVRDDGVSTTLHAEFDQTVAELTIDHDDCSVAMTTIDHKNCEALKTVWDINSGEIRPMKSGWDERHKAPDNNYQSDPEATLLDTAATAYHYQYCEKIIKHALKVSR